MDQQRDIAVSGNAWPSFRAGFRATAGLAVAGGVFGLLFGIIALGRGFTAGTTVLMSSAVFAGSAQVAILELWREPLPYAGLFLAAALVCSRHILMGVTLYDVLHRPGRRAPLGVLFVLTDANFVLTSRERKAANRLAFFAGSGFAMYVGWVVGTAIGVVAPGLLDAQTIDALSVGGALYIAVLLCIYFRGRELPRLAPAATSAAVTIPASAYVDASLALLAGVTAAALVTMLQEFTRRA